MNTNKQYQKVTKKEKIEKIINALDSNNKENGYFEIFLKDGTQINGSKYTIEYSEHEPYIVLRNSQFHFYAIIKVKSIKYIAPKFYSIV